MKRSRTLYRLVVLFAMLLSLVGGAGTAPAQAKESALPTELTSADWAQIQALLPHVQQA